jgi:DNA polymerase I
VTKSQLADFERIVFADFEFIARPGEHPDIVCLAWHELPSRQAHILWVDRLGPKPPYPTDDQTLFVCFVANAELGCHLKRGWPLPANVLDLNPEFRRLVNGRKVPAGKGLLGALAYYGLDSIGAKQKDATRSRIIAGFPFTPDEQDEILKYGASDVDALVRLLPKMLPDIDLERALHRGAFVAASALMEHRGVPIDMEIFRLLADRRMWAAVRDAMVPAIDEAYGVYVRDKAGDWHFNLEKFASYLQREGIAWPVTETGKLSVRGKVFEDMTKGHPQLRDLRELRHSQDKMRSLKLAVGPDGRNRTVLWPFQSKSSRTQPRASQWIFSPAVWLRSLIKPGPGTAVAYVDWSSMEFLVAAALSGDRMMLDFYGRDPYLAFPKHLGLVPTDASKASHGSLRDTYKIGLLAIQYGQGPKGLAARLGISESAAAEMHAQHHELFSTYWAWANDWLAHGLDTGVMWTPLNWAMVTGETEFSERSIINWPVQSSGADILRIAVVWATRKGLRLLAPIHDALLIESPLDRIDYDVALLQELMRRASRIVLNATPGGTIELRTDATVVKFPNRYQDARGTAVWERVLELLAQQQTAKEAAIGG